MIADRAGVSEQIVNKLLRTLHRPENFLHIEMAVLEVEFDGNAVFDKETKSSSPIKDMTLQWSGRREMFFKLSCFVSVMEAFCSHFCTVNVHHRVLIGNLTIFCSSVFCAIAIDRYAKTQRCI